jgi:hypothetical protein
MKETIKLLDGNGRQITLPLPKIHILEVFNDITIEHIRQNTGLKFEKTGFDCMTAQPTKSNQITALLMTYNFKTQYHDNAVNKNVLLLRSDHHIGFKVREICFDCCIKNRINVHGLERGDYLSC